MEELESYSQEYKKRLDEAGERGEIPDNLALEVTSGYFLHAEARIWLSSLCR